MTEEITKGSTVYDSDGYEVEVVSLASPGAVVRRILLDEDSGEPCGYGRVHYIEQVFLKPPLVKLASEYANLQEKVAATRKELYDETHAVATAKRERTQLLAKLQQVPVLQKLADFIDGKITHYVIKRWSGVQILTLEETKSEYADRRSPYKMLSLFGKSDGDLAWRLNHYSDGSGSSEDVFPCLSLEEAETKARELVRAELDACRKDGKIHVGKSHIELAAKYGIEVPLDILSTYRQQSRASAETAVATRRRELAEAEAFLATLPPP